MNLRNRRRSTSSPHCTSTVEGSKNKPSQSGHPSSSSSSSSSLPVINEVNAICGEHAEAVQHFQNGNFQDACDTFARSFAALNRLVRQAKTTNHGYVVPGSPIIAMPIGSPEYLGNLHPDIANDIEHENDSMDSKNMKHLQEQESVVQRKRYMDGTVASITKNIHHIPLVMPTKATLDQFIFIAMYNLALTTHLLALQLSSMERTMKSASSTGSSSTTTATATTTRKDNGKDSIFLLNKAGKIWELVYAFQWRPNLNLKPLHAMAILLNLGQVQLMIGNSHGSRKCFQNIISAVQILSVRNQKVPQQEFFLSLAFRMLNNGDQQWSAGAA